MFVLDLLSSVDGQAKRMESAVRWELSHEVCRDETLNFMSCKYRLWKLVQLSLVFSDGYWIAATAAWTVTVRAGDVGVMLNGSCSCQAVQESCSSEVGRSRCRLCCFCCFNEELSIVYDCLFLNQVTILSCKDHLFHVYIYSFRRQYC